MSWMEAEICRPPTWFSDEARPGCSFSAGLPSCGRMCAPKPRSAKEASGMGLCKMERLLVN